MEVYGSGSKVPAGGRAYWQIDAPAGLAIVGVHTEGSGMISYGVNAPNWGWGGGFDWHQHAIIVNRAPWERNWSNRGAYVHNWNNWDGGQWHNQPVRHEVVVNHVDVRREVIPEREAPVVRREELRPEHNAPNVRESYRPSAPAPAAPPSRGYDRKRAPERQPEHNGRPGSPDEARFRR